MTHRGTGTSQRIIIAALREDKAVFLFGQKKEMVWIWGMSFDMPISFATTKEYAL